MKITNEIKKTAAQLFATSVKENVLFINTKGNFFTNKNRAELSDNPKNISTINRGDVAELIEELETSKKEPDTKEKTDADKKELKDKTIANFKELGDKLLENLGEMKQTELKKCADTLGIVYPGVVKNSVLVEEILKVIKEA